MNLRSPAWKRFRANRRGWWSLWLFVGLYAASLCAGLYCGDPHAVYPASVLDPHLRPAVVSAGHYPVAAVEVADERGVARSDSPPLPPSERGVARSAGGSTPCGDLDLAQVRAWGDTNAFATALSSPLPDALAPALAARLRGEAAPAFEFATNGISYRLAAAQGRRDAGTHGPATARVYLRRADWRTAAPEPPSAAPREAGSVTGASAPGPAAPLEPAVFPFRPIPGPALRILNSARLFLICPCTA